MISLMEYVRILTWASSNVCIVICGSLYILFFYSENLDIYPYTYGISSYCIAVIVKPGEEKTHGKKIVIVSVKSVSFLQ
jgi:hypothetical protein